MTYTGAIVPQFLTYVITTDSEIKYEGQPINGHGKPVYISDYLPIRFLNTPKYFYKNFMFSETLMEFPKFKKHSKNTNSKTLKNPTFKATSTRVVNKFSTEKQKILEKILNKTEDRNNREGVNISNSSNSGSTSPEQNQNGTNENNNRSSIFKEFLDANDDNLTNAADSTTV